MDTFAKIFYVMGHETSWNANPVGNAQASCDCVTESRETVSDRSRDAGLLPELGGAVVSNLPERRAERIAPPADARTPAQPFRTPKKQAEADSSEGADVCRVLHRSVDVEAHRGSDRKAFRGELQRPQ